MPSRGCEGANSSAGNALRETSQVRGTSLHGPALGWEAHVFLTTPAYPGQASMGPAAAQHGPGTVGGGVWQPCLHYWNRTQGSGGSHAGEDRPRATFTCPHPLVSVATTSTEIQLCKTGNPDSPHGPALPLPGLGPEGPEEFAPRAHRRLICMAKRGSHSWPPVNDQINRM